MWVILLQIEHLFDLVETIIGIRQGDILSPYLIAILVINGGAAAKRQIELNVTFWKQTKSESVFL